MAGKRKLEKDILLQNIDLAPFTSWKIGGPAEYFFWPSSLNKLSDFFKNNQKLISSLSNLSQIRFLGLGSNVLIPDKGLKGLTILTLGSFSDLEILSNSKIRAGAGLSCAQVARFGAKNNIISGEFLAGIPGTIGGALFMNAGAFGGEIWEYVESVKVLDSNGNIIVKEASEFKHSYRHCEGLLSNQWFVEVILKLKTGDGKSSLQKIKDLLSKRSETQPTGEPSCGSVFRNPDGDYAARLIESCGLKGYRLGQAQVSNKHANFIVNLGGACSEDVLNLIQMIQSTVASKTGVVLKREVLLVASPS